MGLAFASGRAWGRMSYTGRLISVVGIGLVVMAPYFAFQYAEHRAAKAAEAERLAIVERVRQRQEIERARVAALTPEQRAAEQHAAGKRAEEAKDQAAAVERAQADAAAGKAKRESQLRLAKLAARELRSAMKDPEAFVITAALLLPSGAACYSYRAKNTYGATFPSAAMLHMNGRILVQERDGSAFVAAWNKECTRAGADDITEMLKRDM